MVDVPEEDDGENPSPEQIEEIRRSIAEQKRARGRSGSHSNGYNKKLMAIIVPHMEKDPDRVYPIGALEVRLVLKGQNYSGIGPATTYGVREGIIERVGKGLYKLKK